MSLTMHHGMDARSAIPSRAALARWVMGFLLVLGVFLCLSPASHASETAAIGVRIGGDKVRTRFVADLSGAVSYTVYVLPDPYRVMIDLPGVRFDLPPDSGTKTRGLISAFRYGEVEEGRSRFVIDTEGPVLIEKSFIVDRKNGQPARIVVDLVQTTPEAFQAAYKSDEDISRDAIAQANDAKGVAEESETPDEQVAEAAPIPRPKPGSEPAAQEQPATKRKAEGSYLIVIDPGHGGIDPGAIGRNRTKEKDVVLAFGLRLRDILAKRGNYQVVMTRADDKFLSLKERVRVARNNEADLFIAIHADTVRGQEARGATIYTLSEKASDAEAEALAHKENRADIIGGIDLGTESEEVTDILIDLVQRESKNHATFFAKGAVGEMKAVTKFTGKPLRSAGFVVLKAPDVPSVLVELGYLSSKHDESQLTSPEWRDRVASAMARAVDKYFTLQVAAKSP